MNICFIYKSEPRVIDTTVRYALPQNKYRASPLINNLLKHAILHLLQKHGKNTVNQNIPVLLFPEPLVTVYEVSLLVNIVLVIMYLLQIKYTNGIR